VPTNGYAGVVFDFGGVIITPITRLLEEIAGWHGVSMVEMLDVLMGPRDVSTADHPWHRCERGEVPLAVIQQEVLPFAEAAGLRLRGDEYARLLCGEYSVNGEVVERIARLRTDGYAVGLLTNSFKEFRPILESHVDFGVFDVVVDSSQVGCRKPEPQIYDITAERMGVPGERLVYLDDFAANVDGARRAGWTTIHVADVDTALIELDRVLGRAGDVVSC
jgi:epoxide hydrolase-like predicted phosphatase